jgi:hypothetical protein
MQQLREQGIYTLPEGGEFVVHAVLHGGYVLYTPGAWEFFGAHAYESDARGTIHLHGRSTRWQIKDLTDTRRTARSRSRSGAAQAPSHNEEAPNIAQYAAAAGK